MIHILNRYGLKHRNGIVSSRKNTAHQQNSSKKKKKKIILKGMQRSLKSWQKSQSGVKRRCTKCCFGPCFTTRARVHCHTLGRLSCLEWHRWNSRVSPPLLSYYTSEYVILNVVLFSLTCMKLPFTKLFWCLVPKQKMNSSKELQCSVTFSSLQNPEA